MCVLYLEISEIKVDRFDFPENLNFFFTVIKEITYKYHQQETGGSAKGVLWSTKPKAEGTALEIPMLRVMRQLGWEGSLGENGSCVCMAESPSCPPKTVTLLTGYTPMQNQTFLKLG